MTDLCGDQVTSFPRYPNFTALYFSNLNSFASQQVS